MVAESWQKANAALAVVAPQKRRRTERHELTSWRSFNSIFQFFSEALQSGEKYEESSITVTTRSSHRTKHKQDHDDL
ncbi:hypothetical protein DPEC_G00125200 [Dallia pectoralis]|uniref:Uncharacterized protein n=1 Tax=Dallia pectoralis TaxID=75939 RepID=A0ACC2GRT5_DALPE|nr:hypothetical protein DPEC_G00125200 [Dallia pectoralis]